MAKVTLIEALTMAMAHEMKNDNSVVVLGEDVGVNGGVFRATAGLQEQFGKERVIDTPLAEALIAGISIGMATQGMKPIAEIQFSGFIYPAVDQMVNHAGRLRTRTRGRLHVPMVLRAPSGGGIHAPEHHSESNEAMFAHMPGIRVVMPSSPRRAYGLLLASIRDPDPVVFLEPTRLYRMNKQDVEDNGEALPLDTCFVLKEGTDVTLVSWGAMIHETLLAAKEMEAEGISCEVIDVATVSPIDYETILDSVEKTGRLVIIHEAPKTAGLGAEIAAEVADQALFSLEAPIVRVTGYDTPMPLFKLEHDYMPSVGRVLKGIRRVLED
ncbi:MAG TPA: alpha-ketoacid dehydrogenase subunit beta [Gammaproteobacteria bacterium]